MAISINRVSANPIMHAHDAVTPGFDSQINQLKPQDGAQAISRGDDTYGTTAAACFTDGGPSAEDPNSDLTSGDFDRLQDAMSSPDDAQKTQIESQDTPAAQGSVLQKLGTL